MDNDRQRIFPLARLSNYLAILCVGALVLSLTGCTKSRQEPYLVLESASILGPDGRIELEAANEKSKGRSANWALGILGPTDDDGNSFAFFPFGSRGARMIIVRPIGLSGLSFDIVEVLYQLNGGREMVLELLDTRHEEYGQDRSQAVVDFMRPGNLADVTSHEHGSHLTRMFELIEDQNGDIHRFYIKFTMNNQPYVMDTSFKIKLDRVWYSNAGSFGGVP